MSFLYKNRAKRSFQQSRGSDSEASQHGGKSKNHDDSDDDDDVNVEEFFNNSKGNKKKSKNTTAVNISRSNVDSSSSQAEVQAKKRNTTSLPIVMELDHDDDQDDDLQRKVKEEIERLQGVNHKTQSLLEHSLSPGKPNGDDEVDQSLLELKKKISTSRQRINSTTQANQLLTSSSVIDLSTSSSSVYIPKVKSAQEREREAEKLLAEKNKALHQTRKTPSTTGSSSSSAPTTSPFHFPDDGSDTIRVKTRLGTHEREWTIPLACNIIQLKSRLSILYGISDSKISIRFDGAPLRDNSTIEDADLEEDDLLEVNIDKSLIPKAIDFAKNLLNNQNRAASSSSNQGQQYSDDINDDEGDNALRVKTRLGNHEKEWNISAKSKSLILKKRLAVLYNLPEGKVSICFDGSTLKDTVTLEDAGIEDEDLLDVKIEKNLIPQAIEFAKSSKK